MIKHIETYRIVPNENNPRKELGNLEELRDSIAANGILQNLTVVPASAHGVYKVVIGHRRLAAAMEAGLETVPCVVVEMDEKTQASTMLLENMQRSDLTIYEQAQGMQMCLDLGMTEEEISSKTGFSKSTVRRRLNVLTLDAEKVKQAQGTIEDYIALEEISDVDVRNKLLQFMGTNNFDLEVEKAKQKQNVTPTFTEENNNDSVAPKIVGEDENDPLAILQAKLELYKTLRVNFMTDVFNRKIVKEETAACVLAASMVMKECNFEIYGDTLIYENITSLDGLRNDSVMKRIENNRINFFAISMYCIVERMCKLVDVYNFIEIFGYVLSTEEMEYLENDQD